MCVHYDIDSVPGNGTVWTYLAVTESEVRYRQSTGQIISVQDKKAYQRVYL